MPLVFLNTAAAETSNFSLGGQGSLWQALAGMAIVFGLLMLFLKVLGRLNKNHGSVDSSMVAVWHLGPKREIQVLRLGDNVHYIYRYDGSMVLLKEEPLAEFLANYKKENEEGDRQAPWKKLLGNKASYFGAQTTS
jgi:hypothetical protein